MKTTQNIRFPISFFEVSCFFCSDMPILQCMAPEAIDVLFFGQESLFCDTKDQRAFFAHQGFFGDTKRFFGGYKRLFLGTSKRCNNWLLTFSEVTGGLINILNCS